MTMPTASSSAMLSMFSLIRMSELSITEPPVIVPVNVMLAAFVALFCGRAASAASSPLVIAVESAAAPIDVASAMLPEPSKFTACDRPGQCDVSRVGELVRVRNGRGRDPRFRCDSAHPRGVDLHRYVRAIPPHVNLVRQLACATTLLHGREVELC